MKLRIGLSPTAGLLLLSALWAFSWLLTDLLPHFGGNAVPLPLRQALLFFIFAAMSSIIVAVRKLTYPRGRRAWACIAIGLGLFVVPSTGAALAQRWVSNFDVVAALCFTAFFAVILEPHLQDGPPPRGRAALPAVLIAMAGILLLFPLEMPSSFQGRAALCALLATAFALAAANCIAVRLARTVAGRSIFPMAAQASGAATVCFAVLAAFSRNIPWDSSPLQISLVRLFLVDLPGLFLLFWLMSRLAASRLTARFLLAPLFASLGGLALVDARPSLGGLLGIVLLAGGSGWLVFAPAESREQERISITGV